MNLHKEQATDITIYEGTAFDYNEEQYDFSEESYLEQEYEVGQHFELEEHEIALTSDKQEELMYKLMFYDNLFVTKELFTKNESNQKVKRTQTECTNIQFQKFINAMFNKYNHEITNAEIMSEVMYESWLVIKDFNITTYGVTWQDMIKKRINAMKELSMLFGKMKKIIKAKLWLHVYDLKHTTQNGEAIYISQTLESLNALPDDMEDGQTLLDTVSQSFWTTDDNSKPTPFKQWFNTYKEDFLTKAQIEFIENVSGANVSNGLMSVDAQDTTGYQASSINRYIQRIANQTLDAYNSKAWQERYKMLSTIANGSIESFINLCKEDMKAVRPYINKHESYKEFVKDLRAKKPKIKNATLIKHTINQEYKAIKGLYSGYNFKKTEAEKSKFDYKKAQKRHQESTQASDVIVYNANTMEVKHIEEAEVELEDTSNIINIEDYKSYSL